jgi:hypothetical protein
MHYGLTMHLSNPQHKRNSHKALKYQLGCAHTQDYAVQSKRAGERPRQRHGKGDECGVSPKDWCCVLKSLESRAQWP